MPAPAAALNAHHLFALLVADLEEYVVDALHGIFSVARDPFEVIELLGEAPGKFRVILAWEGEESIGTRPQSGIVKHRFKVVVSHNRGLSILRGENRTVARGDDPPLMELAQLVRDHLRSALLPDGETGIQLEYAGCDPIRAETTQGLAAQLDAFELTFRLPAALTRFTEDDRRELIPA